MIQKIKQKIRKQLRIDQIMENQQRIKSMLDFLTMQNAELLKSAIFNSTIKDSIWLKYKSFSPGNSAVDFGLLYTLYRVLNDVRPKNVLEFGLGQSSKMIHQYGTYFSDVEATTCEHDKNWIKFFKSSVEGDYPINIKYLGLKNVTLNGKDTLSYENMDKEFVGKKYDFILVDAPFGYNQKYYSRTQILDLLENNLCENFCIIVDDYEREGEKQTVKELKKRLNNLNIRFVERVYSASKEHNLICSEKWKFLTTL